MYVQLAFFYFFFFFCLFVFPFPFGLCISHKGRSHSIVNRNRNEFLWLVGLSYDCFPMGATTYITYIFIYNYVCVTHMLYA